MSYDVDAEFRAIVNFARGSRVETGFGYLNSDGTVDADRPAELWITCRMTHVFALAHLRGIERTKELAEHGVQALTQYFADPEFGGWYSAIGTSLRDGAVVPVNDRKEAYAHAFVLLAANSALAAGCDGAGELLAEAEDSQEERWFEPQYGRVRESWNREFTKSEAYRGVNANMHTTEAYLAVADATDNRMLLDRAVGILRFVSDQARSHDWRIPEHFSETWRVIPDFNEDRPADPFRPFGVTPGHGLEWARLMLQARGSLIAAGVEPEAWMLDSARALYNRAVIDGWHVDGQPGFVYTTAFDGQPVVRQRMHWVLCEAVGAGIILARVLEQIDPSDPQIPILHRQVSDWMEYAQEYLVASPGHWKHELDPENQLAFDTWPGMPDAYHVAQMLLLPSLPVSPAFAAALAAGLTAER